tara:strand:+ start:79 stop:1257 length:1179 start_codon:yes stop_codon:yes gene_type:complete
MGKDYYDILGVNRNASEDDIKKSYKKLAMKHHPDRNPKNRDEAEQKFKEISHAYNVLTDKQKKTMYDQFGEEGLQGSGGMPPNFNPFSMFEDMFGNSGDMPGAFHFNMNGMNGMNGMGNQNQNNHQEIKKIKVSLQDLYKGKKMTFSISKTVLNPKKKKLITTCSHCNGSGIEVRVQQLGPIIQQMQAKCSHCNGSGKTIPKECLENVKEKIHINIEKGMCNGEQIILKNKGNFNSNTMSQNDLVFVIIEEEHPNFKRVDNNLMFGLDINLIDALTGFSFVFKHLDDEEILISSDTIIKNEEIKVIKNKGLPYNNNADVFGDLIIKFNIVFPEKINIEQQDLLKSVLPETIFPKIDDTKNYTIFTLSEYNKKKYERDEEQNNHENMNRCQQQ